MRILATMVLAFLVMTAPTQAHAGLQLYAMESGVNGGAVTQIGSGADFTSAGFTGVYGDFTITLLGVASHNTPNISSLLTATVSLQNNDTVAHTIMLYATQTDYTLPTGTPLSVESGLSGTVNTGTLTGSGVFQAFLDSNNAPLGANFTNGPQSVVFTGSTFDTGSAVGSFDRTNPMYSITSKITADVSGGGEGNFSSHVNVTATPAPAGAVLALTGAPVLGLFGWLRRRKAVSM